MPFGYQAADDVTTPTVELAIRHRPAHADISGAIAITVDVGDEEVADRGIGGRIDVGRNALGVGFQPNPLHHVLASRIRCASPSAIARRRSGRRSGRLRLPCRRSRRRSPGTCGTWY